MRMLLGSIVILTMSGLASADFVESPPLKPPAHLEPTEIVPETAPSVAPDSLEARLTKLYGERCKLAGYHPGTGAFGQCLLVYADRDEAWRRAVAAQLIGQIYQQQMNQRPIQATLPMPQQAICTMILGNQLVSRPCY